jgi:hypothetical protein
VVRRVEIEPHDVAQLVDEVRVGRQLEPGDAMRLKSLLVPDIADGFLAHLAGTRHGAGAPMRRARWCRRQCRRHDRLDARRRQALATPGARRILQHPAHSRLDVPRDPVVHMIPTDAQAASNLARANMIGQPEQQLRADGNPLRGAAARRHARQLRALGDRQHQTQG